MYQQYTNPSQMYQQMIQPLQQQFLGGPQKQEVVKVSGRPGADAFNMAPDSSALLLDTTQPIVWLAQTDGAGYKTLTPYDISPHVEESKEDRFKLLDERITRLEEKLDDKSYSGTNDKHRGNEQHNASGNRSNDKG